MKRLWHDFLDENKKDRHKITQIRTLSKMESQSSVVSDLLDIELIGIGLNISIGDIILYSPIEGQTFLDNDDNIFKIEIAVVKDITYNHNGITDAFRSAVVSRSANKEDVLQWHFKKQEVIQIFYDIDLKNANIRRNILIKGLDLNFIERLRNNCLLRKEFN